MNRLWERFGDYILLAGLVLISGVTMLTVNTSMVRGLRAQSLQVVSAVESRLAGAGRYLAALSENERLREENIRLSSELALARESTIENGRLRGLLALPDSVTGARIAAQVVSKDISRQRNTLVINVGSNDGISRKMAVIEPRGVIGEIDMVSDDYSVVKTFLNPGFETAVMIQPHLSDGFVSRSTPNPGMLQVTQVPATDPVEIGQSVVTNLHSGTFRPGLPIGEVVEVSLTPASPTYDILVAPYAPISRLQHVFVLLERPDTELTRLLEEASQ